MIGQHPDIGPELQKLAQTILGVLDPLVQAGVAVAQATDGDAPGKCTQAWCPVCAMAAVASGEQHPLATLVAEQGVALLALIRAIAKPDEPEPPSGGAQTRQAEQPPWASSRYQPIMVTIHE